MGLLKDYEERNTIRVCKGCDDNYYVYITDRASKKYISDMLNHWREYADRKSEGDRDHYIWKGLYDLVFSKEISSRIYELYPDFYYTDPDTTYYEDVTAYISSFGDYANEDC